MSVKTVEEVSAEVPAEDFQALEEKVYRTIELYKAAKEARATAERDVKRLREQLEEREEENETMRRELIPGKHPRAGGEDAGTDGQSGARTGELIWARLPDWICCGERVESKSKFKAAGQGARAKRSRYGNCQQTSSDGRDE